MSQSSSSPPLPDAGGEPRRGFFSKLAAGAIGAVVGIAPLIPGVMVFTDPLRRKNKASSESEGASGNPADELPGVWVKVTTLDQLPVDPEVPRRFTLSADRRDAWTFYENEPIGAIYLRRFDADQPPQAITVICPHLGCAVRFDEPDGEYKCPCHESAFQVDGAKIHGPSARGLDDLPVEIRNNNEVWVKYQRFARGGSEKRVEA